MFSLTAAYSPVRFAWLPPVSTIQREYPHFEKSKSTLFITGFFVSLKSISTKPPTDEAIWSIRPQGFPKYLFSAYCAICAISSAETLLSLKRLFSIVPIRTSNAAEEESPEPDRTFDVVYASKAPTL